MTGRRQLVTVNGTKSELHITGGVPTGIILGPLLFLYYVNDMSFSIRPGCNLLIYADYNTIIFSFNLIQIFSHKVPIIISQKLGLFTVSLHLGKTECIIFGPKRKLMKGINFHIEMYNVMIILLNRRQNQNIKA